MIRLLFLLPAISLPASFIGLALYYAAIVPTKDDFFVGRVGVATGAVLLGDAVIGVIGLVGFFCMVWSAAEMRRETFFIAVLSVLATAATYGLAMQVLRLGYRLHA